MKGVAMRAGSLAGGAAGGWLLARAYAPWNEALAAWVVFGALTVLFLTCRTGPREGAWSGGLMGLAFFGTSLFWVTEVTVPGWVVLVLLMAVYPAAWGWVWACQLRRQREPWTSWNNLRLAAGGACAWTALEWVRGWLWTGFPWNFAGVSQVEMLPLVQAASWGGVLLVSWVVVFVSLVLGLTVVRLVAEARGRQVSQWRLELTVAVLLVAVLFYTGWRRMQGAPPAELTVEVLAVQPSLPQDPWGPGITAGAALEELLLLSRTGMVGGGVDLVVWPETPVGEELRGQPAVRELVEGGGVALLFGSNLWESGRVYNAALFQEPGREAQVYRKSHLVMMGEYVPLRDMLPWLRKFVPVGQDFSAGREHAVLRDATGMLRMAPLICFEDTFGRVARRFVPGNPNLLVNLTNDGWFGRSAQSRQHLANAQFRAVELGIPLLRVANTGVTAVVDQYGRVQARLGSAGDGSLWGRGFLRHTVGLPAPGGGTFYARHGDWPGPLCLAATVLLVWWERRSKAA